MSITVKVQPKLQTTSWMDALDDPIKDPRIEGITSRISKLEASEEHSEKKLNVGLLNESNVDDFFSLYGAFIDNFAVQNEETAKGVKWMKDDFPSVRGCQFHWRELDVHLSMEQMERTLLKTNVLQLRPVDQNCKILIIGCGNRPIADMGGYPISDQSRKYQLIHAHPNAITINPHLAYNPALLAFFGAQKLPMLETGQFDLIVIEATSICDTAVGRSELERLLSPKGQVVVSLGNKEAYKFSWDDNQGSSWSSSEEYGHKLVFENLNQFDSFNYSEI